MSNYVKLLQGLNVVFTSENGSNAVGHCPLHSDTKASFAIEVDKGLWKCFNPDCEGSKGGNFSQLYEKLTGNPWEEDLEVPLVEVEKFHAILLKDHTLMKWLLEMRGINEETVKKFKLGFDGERIQIPIMHNGKCVNIRRHAVKKNAQVKTLSYQAGYGGVRLFPEENLQGSEIVFCEGELDAILACQMGFNAITTTGGASSWKTSWNKLFEGKKVWVCYDVDPPGRLGAEHVCFELHKHASEVKNVLLPLMSPSNADITDYFAVFGHSVADFKQLIDSTVVWSPAIKPVVNGARPEAKEIDLGKASEGQMMNNLVKMRVTVAGKDLAPYACPKSVKLSCNSSGQLKICKLCSITQSGGAATYEINPLSLEILKLINCTDEQQRGFIRKAAGVYPGCPRFDLTVAEYYSVEDIRLIPELGFSTQQDSEYVVRPAFFVGNSLRANNTYEVEGLATPNPKNQYVTFLLDQAKQVKGDIDGFTMTPELIESLGVFKAEPGQVENKLTEIATDLTANVTRIYQREVLVRALDMVFHSVLQFNFQDRLLKKGWVEALIIGDTRCGKTETVSQLVNHYRAGELSTGENASFAGLIGGMQQVGSRWSIIWGKLPLNDRRLLVIDEVSGMTTDDIGRMSGVRSSGIAEIIKVQSERTYSRTRLIWLGNPRSPRSLGTYDSGIQAVKELIGRPEDVARFDLAATVASGEVPIEVINQVRAEAAKVKHQFTSDLCHKLVMWCWSRKPHQVVFLEGVEKACLKLAGDLSKRYSAAIPLVEPAEQRVKLARLAVATAGRLFSSSPDGETLIVTSEHVQAAHDLLEKLYQMPSMGYLGYSKLKLAEQTLKDPQKVLDALNPFGMILIEGFLERQYLRLNDLEDLLNLEKKDVKPLVATLVQQRALKHYGTMYVKSQAFIELLRKLQAEVQIPVKEEF